MNYKRIYDEIINNARKRGNNKHTLKYYTERHHILPKCQGGTNDLHNLVLLTGREHYICHKILFKLNPDNYKLGTSWILMHRVVDNNDKNSKTYHRLKEAFSKLCSKRMQEYYLNPENSERELARIEKIKKFQKNYRKNSNINHRVSLSMKLAHANRTADEKLIIGENISKARKDAWDTKSDDYKNQYKSACALVWVDRKCRSIKISDLIFNRLGLAYKYVIDNSMFTKSLAVFKNYIKDGRIDGWHYV